MTSSVGVGEDPAVNTPRELYGEEAYVKFVTSYDPVALRGDALRYNVQYTFILPSFFSSLCMNYNPVYSF